MVRFALIVILVFYCCVRNHSEFNGIDQQSFIVSGDGQYSAGGSLLQVSYAVVVRWWPGRLRQRGPGTGAVPQAFPPWVGSPCGLCSVEASRLLDFLGSSSEFQKHVSLSQERECQAGLPFYAMALEVLQSHFCRPHALLKKQVRRPVLKGKVIRLYLLVGGVSKDLQIVFKKHLDQ